MTLNTKSLPKSSANRKPATARNDRDRMTAIEEKALARVFQEVKEGKVRTFKNADEYLKYLYTV